ncbi:OTU-domain-containing protein [Wilcoxina mikolae CBS 423.85]|nr:OTU-domain-containing protein [Wilcoxina mikolae CBS 423.85]
MRLKIRSPAGTQVLTLPEDATISTLLTEIRQATSISGDLDIKYGYPPKPLQLTDHSSSTLLSELPMKLQGEQLIISSSESAGGGLRGTGAGVIRDASSDRATTGPEVETDVYPAASTSRSNGAAFSFSTGSSSNKSSSTANQPLSLARAAPKLNKDDPPDVVLPNGRGTVVLRVMEDDNSCLFRALSYVLTGSMMSVVELRQLVAETIQANSDKYNEVVLEQKVDAYCEWIKMESSWGGGIELGIFADFFDVEICTIDVATGSLVRFNEGKDRRVIVVYSGIHYDALALSPLGASVHDSDRDEMVFDKNDQVVLAAAQELCTKLRQKHYFTDTKNFSVKCNICQKLMKGQNEAVAHAAATGHTNFGES